MPNSALIPGSLQTVKDSDTKTGLKVTYRIGIHSTEVFVKGNLTNDFQFTAWKEVDLGWIPVPNRPTQAVTQFIVDPFYITVQINGHVQIISSETRKGSGLYIDAHTIYLNASV